MSKRILSVAILLPSVGNTYFYWQFYLISPSKEILVLLFEIAVGMYSHSLCAESWMRRSILPQRLCTEEPEPGDWELLLSFETLMLLENIQVHNGCNMFRFIKPSSDPHAMYAGIWMGWDPRPSVIALLFFMLIIHCVTGFLCFLILGAHM